MLLEYFETDLNLHLLFALGLGAIFGIAAQISRFCLRRAVAGDDGPDRSAAAVWLTALATAIAAFSAASSFGFVDLSGHRYLSSELPIVAILVGGLAFGAGMVLTRGCVSRLTVLSGTGNLRAIVVLSVFALVAHATLKGVLAPVRTTLGSLTLSTPLPSLAEITGLAPTIAIAIFGAAFFFARQSNTQATHLILGAVIGLVAVGGWAATSVLLFDEFDPMPVQSAAFTLPWSDTLFWTIASTAIPVGFGVGFIAGVLGGSFVSAAARGELQLQGFENHTQMLRYGAGGALMGVGGVLAGGCTVGAGLSGGAMLSVAALLALASIVTGGVTMRALLQPRASLKATV